MTRLLPLALIAACTGAAEPEATADPAAPLSADGATLPVAVAGAVYQAPLSAEGGAPPYTWALASGALPAPLTLNPAGVISGVPLDPDQHDLSLEVTDAAGQTATATLTLTVADAEGRLDCGGALSGAWTEAAVGSWGDDLDLTAEGGLARLWIAPPEAPTTRVEVLVASAVEGYAFVGSPGTPLDSESPADFRTTLWMEYGDSLVVDLLTVPDLETWRATGQPIPLVLAGARPGSWTATVRCTDGPILRGLTPYPVEVGQPLTFNAGAANETGEITFALDGALPAWATFDPETGRIEGVAEEAGAWEFALTATAPDGTSRTEEAGFGVYEVLDLPCDSSIEVRPEESYYAGLLYTWIDPRGYLVHRTDLDDEAVSAVSVTATVGAGGGGSIAAVPPTSSTPFYGSLGGGAYEAGYPATLTRTVADHPGLEAHRAARGGLQAVTTATSLPDAGGVVLTAACDRTPRRTTRMPILEPGAFEEVYLEAAGGTPPVTWAAVDPPAGLTLTPDGVLQADGLAAGVVEVALELTDAEGRVGEEVVALSVGEEAACEGVPRLSCGASVTGALTDAWWSDPAAGTAAWCLAGDHDAIDQLTLTLTHEGDAGRQVLSVGAPGAGPAEVDAGASLDLLAWADPGERVAAVLRDGASADLSIRRHQALPVAVVGYAPGSFTLTAGCE